MGDEHVQRVEGPVSQRSRSDAPPSLLKCPDSFLVLIRGQSYLEQSLGDLRKDPQLFGANLVIERHDTGEFSEDRFESALRLVRGQQEVKQVREAVSEGLVPPSPPRGSDGLRCERNTGRSREPCIAGPLTNASLEHIEGGGPFCLTEQALEPVHEFPWHRGASRRSRRSGSLSLVSARRQVKESLPEGPHRSEIEQLLS